MRDDYTVSPSAVKLMVKLSRWCLVNNSNKFSCFYEFSAHVGSVDISIYPCGWAANDDHIYNFAFNVAGSLYSQDCLEIRVDEFLSECKELKKKYK